MPTVKVRVAVAVDRDGEWCAAGWTSASDDDKTDAAREHVSDGERVYFLTAELQIPVDIVPDDVPASVDSGEPQRYQDKEKS